MALNKRERSIAISLGVIVVGYLGYFYGVDPYLGALQQLKKNQTETTAKRNLAQHLLDNRKSVNDEWKTIIADGLESNASNAESRALHAITDWASNRNVHIDSHKTETPTQTGDFQQMRLTITGSGNLASIWRLLADIETSHLPLQLGECRLASKKGDGSDDLTVQVTVNTLIFSPPQTTTKPADKKPASSGDSI